MNDVIVSFQFGCLKETRVTKRGQIVLVVDLFSCRENITNALLFNLFKHLC